MKIRITNSLMVTGVPENLRAEICGKLTMVNPQWTENERMGRSNYKTEKLLRFYQTTPSGGLIIPRGFGRELIGLARAFDEPITWDDQRITFPETEFQFSGQLRPYQEAAVADMLARDWGVLQAPTGSGKTIMALAMVAARKQPTLVVCHTKELALQWRDRTSNSLGIPENEVGIIGGGKKTIGEKVTVGLVQSLVKCADQVSPRIGHVIIDECFIYGTPIASPGGVCPIEDLSRGDFVFGYDHSSNKVVVTKIHHTFRHQSNSLYRVKLENGQSIECTANHPFYDGKKYIPAHHLKRGQYVWELKDEEILRGVRKREGEHRVVLRCMQKNEAGEKKKSCDCSMLHMWEPCRMPRRNSMAKLSCPSKSGKGLLLDSMRSGSESSSKYEERNISCKIQQGRRPYKQNPEKPHGKPGICSQNDCHEKRERELFEAAANARWQRPGNAGCAKAFGPCAWLGRGVSHQDGRAYTDWQAEVIPVGPQLTNLLQDRYCESGSEDRCGGGRGESQRAEEGIGRKKDEVLKGVRVEDITPIEHSDKERLSGVCSDREVYNIETGTGNYFAGGVLVHNCHRTPSTTFTSVVSAFDCKFMLGLSATPFRRDGLSKVIGFYLGDTIHKVDAGALIEDGSILKAEVIQRETSFRTYRDASAEYSKVLSDLTTDQDRNRLICRDVAGASKHWDGINLVLSDRKGHCEALRSILASEHEIRAEVLTGDLPAKARADLVNRLNAGEIRTLIATGQLIGEGFDSAGLSALFLSTPIRFSGRVLQYMGRILRPAPGKAGAKVFDYIDVNVGVLKASARARARVYAGQ